MRSMLITNPQFKTTDRVHCLRTTDEQLDLFTAINTAIGVCFYTHSLSVSGAIPFYFSQYGHSWLELTALMSGTCVTPTNFW